MGETLVLYKVAYLVFVTLPLRGKARTGPPRQGEAALFGVDDVSLTSFQTASRTKKRRDTGIEKRPFALLRESDLRSSMASQIEFIRD